jgi:hypothetical protein
MQMICCEASEMAKYSTWFRVSRFVTSFAAFVYLSDDTSQMIHQGLSAALSIMTDTERLTL